MATGYKALTKELKGTQRNFQYELGKTYEEEKADLCYAGFHYCENPLDALDFGDLTKDDFYKVEADEVETDGKKSVSTKIKIEAKLELPDFIKAAFSFIWERTKVEDTETDDNDGSKLATSGDGSKLATSGNDSQLATSGYGSQLATSGYGSQLATSGDCSKLATSGDYSQLATSGDGSKLATSGYGSQLATSGYYSKLATSGDGSKLATSGYGSQLATSGNGSQLATSGNDSQLEISGKGSVGASIGYNGKIKGIIGTWITLAEYNDEGKVIVVKSAQIDGDKLKADIWYKLENKKFVEAE